MIKSEGYERKRIENSTITVRKWYSFDKRTKKKGIRAEGKTSHLNPGKWWAYGGRIKEQEAEEEKEKYHGVE